VDYGTLFLGALIGAVLAGFGLGGMVLRFAAGRKRKGS
jgi:hypothetical protein